MAFVAATSLLFVTGCATGPPGSPTSGAELHQFRQQTLEFGACDPTIVGSQPPVPEYLEALDGGGQ